MTQFPSKTMLATGLSSLAVALLLAGCGTGAHVVDSNGPELITTIDKPDIQDFHAAAKQMLESLYQNGALDRAEKKPARIAFNRITNDTDNYFDSDLLVRGITEDLQNSGKAVVDTLWGAKPIDPNNPGLLSGKVILPEFTLVGKIFKNTARAGKIKQATFTFQLIMSDNTGASVWQAQRQITKQGSHATIGL